MVVIHRIYIKYKRRFQIQAFTLNDYVPLLCTGVTFVTKLPCYYGFCIALMCAFNFDSFPPGMSVDDNQIADS